MTYATGGSTAVASPANAAAGTGNGGPSGVTNTGAFNGGSGKVVIAYPGPQRGSGGAYSYVGGNSIHTFTTSGAFTA